MIMKQERNISFRSIKLTAAMIRFSLFFRFIEIKARINRIKILTIEIILHNSQTFTKPLEMNDFAFPQVSDRIDYIRIVYHP